MRLTLPLFIVFEGIDGSGKTTLSHLLYNYYLSMGIPAVKIKEPSNGKWGKKIREMLRGGISFPVNEQLSLFLLDREDDNRNNILPSINGKKMIIMDRYYYSNVAYQGAMGIPPASIIFENRKREFPEPHRVYLIDINPEEAIERIKNRMISSDIFEKKIFLERVRKIYHTIADDRFLIIDGSNKPEEIIIIIKEDIEKNFCIP